MDLYNEPELWIVLAIYAVVFGTMGIGWLIGYIFRGIGMFSMAKKLGIEPAWMAYIPYARTYLNGKLAGLIKHGNKTLKEPGLWLLLAPIVVSILSVILLTLFVISTAFQLIALEETYFSGLEWTVIVRMGVSWVLIILVGVAGQVLVKVLQALINFNIYRRFVDSNRAQIHAVAGLLIPLYQSIYFFVLRNRPLREETEVVPELPEPVGILEESAPLEETEGNLNQEEPEETDENKQ